MTTRNRDRTPATDREVSQPGSAGTLAVHSSMQASRANGPGLRFVVWLQGCHTRCPGCCNPDIQEPPKEGQAVSPDDLLEAIRNTGQHIEGVTISGGEPLEQAAPLHTFLQKLKKTTTLSVVLFTGRLLENIISNRETRPLLDCIDVLIDGPYREDLHLGQGLRGSSNQRIHFFSDRYGMGDFAQVPQAELVIGPDGALQLTGVDSQVLEQFTALAAMGREGN